MHTPPALRVFLVRHGQVAANRSFRYVGRLDQELTEAGLLQAKQLGDALSTQSVRLILTSPLARTRATAQQIASACGLETEADDRLIEQSFGDWEGLTRTEVKALGESHRSALRQFDTDPSFAPPGGESLSQIQDRASALVRDLLAREEPGPVVLVSHVGPIKALLASALEISLPRVRPFFLDPGTISVVDWGERAWLRLFNAHAHMGWGNARWMKSEQ